MDLNRLTTCDIISKRVKVCIPLNKKKTQPDDNFRNQGVCTQNKNVLKGTNLIQSFIKVEEK